MEKRQRKRRHASPPDSTGNATEKRLKAKQTVDNDPETSRPGSDEVEVDGLEKIKADAQLLGELPDFIIKGCPRANKGGMYRSVILVLEKDAPIEHELVFNFWDSSKTSGFWTFQVEDKRYIVKYAADLRGYLFWVSSKQRWSSEPVAYKRTGKMMKKLGWADPSSDGPGMDTEPENGPGDQGARGNSGDDTGDESGDESVGGPARSPVKNSIEEPHSEPAHGPRKKPINDMGVESSRKSSDEATLINGPKVLRLRNPEQIRPYTTEKERHFRRTSGQRTRKERTSSGSKTQAKTPEERQSTPKPKPSEKTSRKRVISETPTPDQVDTEPTVYVLGEGLAPAPMDLSICSTSETFYKTVRQVVGVPADVEAIIEVTLDWLTDPRSRTIRLIEDFPVTFEKMRQEIDKASGAGGPSEGVKVFVYVTRKPE